MTTDPVTPATEQPPPTEAPVDVSPSRPCEYGHATLPGVETIVLDRNPDGSVASYASLPRHALPFASTLTPTPPCPDCYARMVWSDQSTTVQVVDEETGKERDVTRMFEVDASAHHPECGYARAYGPVERAEQARAGERETVSW